MSTTTAAEADEILSAIIEPLLARHGFNQVARRRWVRSFPPVRHLFEIAAMKGAQLSPRWGFSLDFVPHVKGTKLAWHRTEKSALLDLVYDPIDLEAVGARLEPLCWLVDPADFRRHALRLLPPAIARAVEWLDPVRTPAAVLPLAEWLKAEQRGRRFKFDNYVQQPLAYAFLLARAGQRERAHHELEAWIDSMRSEALRDQLVALLVV